MNNALLSKREEIIDWLNIHRVTRFNLLRDDKYGFVVDVSDSVDLSSLMLTEVPVKFNVVDGFFNISNNSIKDLWFCPKEVGADFVCFFNKLESLVGCPSKVYGNFNFSFNNIRVLDGLPEFVGVDLLGNNNILDSFRSCPDVVRGNMDFSNNLITSLEFAPKIIEGYFDFSNNDVALETLVYLPIKVGSDYVSAFNNDRLGNLKKEVGFQIFKSASDRIKQFNNLTSNLDSDNKRKLKI